MKEIKKKKKSLYQVSHDNLCLKPYFTPSPDIASKPGSKAIALLYYYGSEVYTSLPKYMLTTVTQHQHSLTMYAYIVYYVLKAHTTNNVLNYVVSQCMVLDQILAGGKHVALSNHTRTH